MPGPALTVTVDGDTSGLDQALSGTSNVQKIGDLAFSLGQSLAALPGYVSMAADALHSLVELGGPEAQAAMSELEATIGEQLAPVMKELTPLIVDLVEGLAELMSVVLPVLVPLLQGLVSVLGFLFQAVNLVWQVVQSLMDAMKALIDQAVNALWEKLDAIRGMFDLVWTAMDAVRGLVQPLIDAIGTLLGPIQDVVNAVAGLLGDLGEALGLSDDLEASAGGLGGGRRSGWQYQPGTTGYGSIVVNTGADPGATIRAIRRYSASNGGARSFSRNVTGVRGH